MTQKVLDPNSGRVDNPLRILMESSARARSKRRAAAWSADLTKAGASALAGDTPAVPLLREQLWALDPLVDGGVPGLDIFTPDAHPADGRVGLPWAVTGRSGGRDAGTFWLGT